MDLLVNGLIAFALGLVFLGEAVIMSGLDDIRDRQVKLKATVEKLLNIITQISRGAFTPEQQAEIDEIVASQDATLAEDTIPPSGDSGAPLIPPTDGQ